MENSPLISLPLDWSGDNPGIYLKDTADGPYRTLMVWFRIAVSRHGVGHAVVLFEDPTRAAAWPDVANLCLTDNVPLAQDLVARFCTKFGVFQKAAAFDALRYVALDGHEASGDNVRSSRVVARGSGIELDLAWNDLGTPFAADVPPTLSATGQHRMLSVFVESRDASITVNGRRLPGRPFPRPFLGRTMSSAFLAFSESWLRDKA